MRDLGGRMIRAYKKSDVEEILNIWYSASQLAHPFLEEAFLAKEKINIREVHLPNAITWVYDNEGNIDGFISMIGNEVGAIFVRPERHGQGIGKALMDHARSFHQVLEVEVFEQNLRGRAFYDKYGFRLIREYVQLETGQRILRMKYTGIDRIWDISEF